MPPRTTRPTSPFFIFTLMLISDITPTMAAAELVAPDIISSAQGEHSPTFDVTRNELVFMRRTPGLFDYTLYSSKLIDGQWSKPVILPFSGKFRDGGPSFSPDGTVLLYDSKRPIEGLPSNSINLWQVSRVENGWGAPQPLKFLSENDASEPVAGQDEFGPLMTRSGDVLFYSFRSPVRAGIHYQGQVGQQPTLNKQIPDPSAATFVAYLTLSVDGITAVIEGRSLTGNDTDLFYACKKNGQWGQAKPLSAANSSSGDGTPYLTSDSQWLWFASDRNNETDNGSNANIYRIHTDALPVPCT